MKQTGFGALVAGVAVVGMLGTLALAGDQDENGRTLKASLKGIEEPPSISSTGRGTFRATISEDGSSIHYTLSYEGLEGDVQQSHIHLGQRAVNGGIAAFLCTNLGNGPAGTPLCPGPRSGTVSGTITAAEVIGPSGQGLAPGEFEELLRAIARRVTYANVHSTKHPGGEIRGQIDDED
ncbi:MAG TPA: CHRD domain-containing protein [Candidatus Polarisedimenticolia bacterium]|nr:CHRD domain-containing protein [Candidatus Polarisedimenticolia bacterium]